MDKDERLKLVDENGETILMTKSEYLELANQRGWDTQIPNLFCDTLDCDVFGGDNVKFFFIVDISGTLYLKDNSYLEDEVLAQNGIILGDNASTDFLVSDNGDVIVGNNANTCDITGKNVICGHGLHPNGGDISAFDGFVILGKDFNDVGDDDNDTKVSATEDIICDDEPAA